MHTKTHLFMDGILFASNHSDSAGSLIINVTIIQNKHIADTI